MAGNIPPVPISTNIVDPKAKNPGALTPAWFNWFHSVWQIHNNAGHGNNLPSIGGIGNAMSSFAVQLTNMSSGGSGTLNYRLVGRYVYLYAPATISGVTSGSVIQIGGLPVSLVPAHQQEGCCYPMLDAGNIPLGTYQVNNNTSSPSILLGLMTVAGGQIANGNFTGGGASAGIELGWSCFYSLD